MRRVLTKAEAIRLIIWIAAVLIIISIFPLRLWKYSYVTRESNDTPAEVLEMDDRYTVIHSFIPIYSHLEAVDIHIRNVDPWTWMDVKLLDGMGNVIIMDSRTFEEGAYSVPMTFRADFNRDLVPGVMYNIEISTGIMSEAPDGASGYCELGLSPVSETGQETPVLQLSKRNRMDMSLERVEGVRLNTDFDYTLPLGKKLSLILIAAVFSAAFFVTQLIRTLEKRFGLLKSLTTLTSAARAVLCPLIIILSVGAFLECVVLHRFSVHLDDILIYASGIIIFDIWAFRIMFRKRRDMNGSGEIVRKNSWVTADVVFIVAAAFAIHNGVQYLNGVTDASHFASMRNMLIFCGIALFSTFFAGGFTPAPGVRLNLPYAVFTGCFLLLWCIFRNGRIYPLLFTGLLVLFSYRAMCWSRRQYFLRNVSLSLLLNFAAGIVYCLIHRPYLSFTLSRYPFTFASATEASVYLALVFAAAAALEMRSEGGLKTVFRLLLGISGSYLLFTCSRTGILTAFLVLIVMILYMNRGKGGKAALSLASMLLTVILCFPVVFTAQRTIPALTRSPVEIAYEQFPDEILRGDKKDSMWYITFGRFVQVFLEKMAAVQEFSTDLDAIDVVSSDVGYIPQDLSDVSNGRLYIYSLYASGLSPEGHEKMGITTMDGNYIYHAHNIYLQAMWDYGIIIGALFTAWVLVTLIRAFKCAGRSGEGALFMLGAACVFVTAGMFEWISDPCNPVCLVFIQAIAPLFADER